MKNRTQKSIMELITTNIKKSELIKSLTVKYTTKLDVINFNSIGDYELKLNRIIIDMVPDDYKITCCLYADVNLLFVISGKPISKQIEIKNHKFDVEIIIYDDDSVNIEYLMTKYSVFERIV